MQATIENMQRYAGDGAVFAYSPTTGEEYSANPADYWDVPAGWTMTDSNGDPMILARRESRIIEVGGLTMRHPHNGVLLPPELDSATEAQKDAYAERVKANNARFIDACFAVEDAAERLGVELPS